MKINHVAIAVENVEDAAKAYQDALDIKSVEFETVESEGVKVAILHLENANIELMEPTNDSSPIRKFLEKRGSGLHHIACLLYTSPSPRDLSTSRKPSSA